MKRCGVCVLIVAVAIMSVRLEAQRTRVVRNVRTEVLRQQAPAIP